MCCFSGPVEQVAATRIFARPLPDGRQLLAYAMHFSAAADLAMVLPLPTPPASPEDALRFLDLSPYPELFEDLANGFPRPRSKGLTRSNSLSDADEALVVHRVGAFDASFVPRREDFARLDARFRMPEAAWDGLPGVRDWGFAVFKLRSGRGQDAHPMAFSFPRRDPGTLFFPTVHVHDGTAPAQAGFDHTLYWQVPGEAVVEGDDSASWEESEAPAGSFAKVARSAGLLDEEAHVSRWTLRGRRPNRDQVLRLR